MTSSQHLQSFDEIKSTIIKQTNEVAHLKKEITTVKEELKRLKRNDSSNRNPEERLSQTSIRKIIKPIDEVDFVNFVEEKLKRLKRNDSSNRNPEERLSQTSIRKIIKPIDEVDFVNFVEEERIIFMEEETKTMKIHRIRTYRQINSPNTHQSMPGCIKRIFSAALPLFQCNKTKMSSESNIYNNNTLYMLAISIASYKTLTTNYLLSYSSEQRSIWFFSCH